ncbi:TfoX/Sxy family protein [Ekhidna sp.]|uniref:TfoX/Sxy family protein n=1 Tax=Ekhidna sp. TaxID=2608089 RepID=UPI003513DE55
MGQKGDKHTNEAQLSAELILEKLSSINGITSKKMFGGHGIFHEGKMFGIIDSKGKAFLRTNDDSKTAFIEKGAEQHSKMPYHSIPDSILNSDNLIKWVEKSIRISKQ